MVAKSHTSFDEFLIAFSRSDLSKLEKAQMLAAAECPYLKRLTEEASITTSSDSITTTKDKLNNHE